MGNVYFGSVQKETARDFLGDVLISRLATPQGDTIETKINPVNETAAMAAELGVQGGWRSEEAKRVTLEYAVAAVLTGKLALRHKEGGK